MKTIKTFLTACLIMLLSIAAMSQTYQIRYYNIDNPGTRRTVTVNDQGEPTLYYRLAYNDNEEYLIDAALRDKLEESVFPDVPFSVYLPIYDRILFHYDVETTIEPQPGGWTLPVNTYTIVWDVTQEMYDAGVTLISDKMQEYLTIVQERKMKSIPDGPDWRWEFVDMSKSYRDRYTPMTVEVGKFNGQTVWVPTNRTDLWDDFTRTIMNKSNHFKAIYSTKLRRF